MATVKRFIYEFDPTGRSPANLITKERHTITAENRNKQNVLIPGYAPFFRQSLVVIDMLTGRPLLESIDYTCEWPVINTAENTEAYTPLYGGIQFIDNNITGQFELQYQTIGGSYALDGIQIAQALANQANDPLTTTFEDIIGKPLRLPPLEHVHSIEDFVGFEDLVHEISLLKEAIELLAREDRDSHPGYETLVDSYFRLETLIQNNTKLINQLKEEQKAKLQELRDNLTALINKTKTDLQGNIDKVNTDLTSKINKVDTDLRALINTVKTEVTNLITTLRNDFNKFTTGVTNANHAFLNRHYATAEPNKAVNGWFRGSGIFSGVTESGTYHGQTGTAAIDFVGLTMTGSGQTTQFVSIGAGAHYLRTNDNGVDDGWVVERLVTERNMKSMMTSIVDNVVYTTGNQEVDGFKNFVKPIYSRYTGATESKQGKRVIVGADETSVYIGNTFTNRWFRINDDDYLTYSGRRVPTITTNYLRLGGPHTAYAGIFIDRYADDAWKQKEQDWRIETETYALGNRLKLYRSVYSKNANNTDTTIQDDTSDTATMKKQALSILFPNSSGEVVLVNAPVRTVDGGRWNQQYNSGAPFLVGKKTDLDYGLPAYNKSAFYPIIKSKYIPSEDTNTQGAWTIGIVRNNIPANSPVSALVLHYNDPRALAEGNNTLEHEGSNAFRFEPWGGGTFMSTLGRWKIYRYNDTANPDRSGMTLMSQTSGRYICMQDDGLYRIATNNFLVSRDLYYVNYSTPGTSAGNAGYKFTLDGTEYMFTANNNDGQIRLARGANTDKSKPSVTHLFQDKNGTVAHLSDFESFSKGTKVTRTEAPTYLNKPFAEQKNEFLSLALVANEVDTFPLISPSSTGVLDATGIVIATPGQITQFLSFAPGMHYLRTNDDPNNETYANELILTNRSLPTFLNWSTDDHGIVTTFNKNQTINGIKTFAGIADFANGLRVNGQKVITGSASELSYNGKVLAFKENMVALTGAQTIAGVKTFTSNPIISGTNGYWTVNTGDTETGNSGLRIIRGGKTNEFIINGNGIAQIKHNKGANTVTFPAATGTVALTSDVTPIATRLTTLEGKPANAITASGAVLTYAGKRLLNSDNLTTLNNAINTKADKTTVTTLQSDLSGLKTTVSNLSTTVSNLSTTLASKYVTLDTAQTITGAKTFNAATKFANTITVSNQGVISATASELSYINKPLAFKADVVLLTGNQTVAGAKTFSNLGTFTAGVKTASYIDIGANSLRINQSTQDGRNVLYMPDVSVNDIYIRSDRRLKENIEKIENGLDVVTKLQGRTFDWKVSGRHAAGFIAQEVEQVASHLVSRNNDTDKTMSVNYVDIIAYLVEAVKEQQKQIDELKANR